VSEVARKSWRDILPIHPAAQLFPPMSSDELQELGEDIRTNGLKMPLSVFCHDGVSSLLDGCNRLDAMEAVGCELLPGSNGLDPVMAVSPTGEKIRIYWEYQHSDRCDPYAFAISINVHRRHLTTAQKGEVIEKLLKAQPEQSDRAIAKQAHGVVDHKTVAAHREKLQASGEIPHVETRTDTMGRQQPATKKNRRAAPAGPEPKVRQRPVAREAPQFHVPPPPPMVHEAASPAPPTLEDGLAAPISLAQRNRLKPGGSSRKELLNVEPKGGFNRQENDAIEWAQFSWNPITGCEHNCPYCYARDIALGVVAKAYPHRFEPTLHPRRLRLPSLMKVPELAATDTRYRNVFTISMGDMFGRWVPEEWINAVLAEIRVASQWNFLCLTKFPKRMAEFDIPPNAWMGDEGRPAGSHTGGGSRFRTDRCRGEMAIMRTAAGAATVQASRALPLDRHRRRVKINANARVAAAIRMDCRSGPSSSGLRPEGLLQRQSLRYPEQDPRAAVRCADQSRPKEVPPEFHYLGQKSESVQ
jgi:Protein of unknown function (DUF5131)